MESKNFSINNYVNALPYIKADLDNFKGIYTRLPLRNKIPVEIDENLIVEFYSRLSSYIVKVLTTS